MVDQKLKEALEKLGFVHQPDLPGKPDFAHFDAKILICIFKLRSEITKKPLDEWIEERKQRFAPLISKGWDVRRVAEENFEKFDLDRIKGLMTELEYGRFRLPPGPRPTSQKLIELLRQTHTEIFSEEAKRRRNHRMLWGLERRRRNIEKRLFLIFKPKILERDRHKCLVCGSTTELDLAHIYQGRNPTFTDANPRWLRKHPRMASPYVSPEKRWAEENMLILCRSCHLALDSGVQLSGKWNIDKAIQFIQKRRKIWGLAK